MVFLIVLGKTMEIDILFKIFVKKKETSPSHFYVFSSVEWQFLSHQLLLFIGRLKLACEMNTDVIGRRFIDTLFFLVFLSVVKKGTPLK
jgi:hypothetical protein